MTSSADPGHADRLRDEIARSEAALLPERRLWQRRYVAAARTAMVGGVLTAGMPQVVTAGTRMQTALALGVVTAAAVCMAGIAWFRRRGHLAREAHAQAIHAGVIGTTVGEAAAGYLAALARQQGRR